MADKKLKAVITIGGAIASTFGAAIKTTTGRIKEIGRTVRSLEKDHKALGSQIEVWEKQGKNVSALRSQYVKLGSEIDRLRLKQSALKRIVDADVSGSFTRMRTSVGRTALAFTGLATVAIGSIFAIAKSTSDLGDEIGETAQMLGIGTRELQELRYAAMKAGVETEQFDKGLEVMIKNIAEAANGSGKAGDALKELGLDAAALASMTPDEMLNHLADAFGKVQNHSEKLRLAFRIFGKGGAPMILLMDQGSKGLARLRREAQATGYVLSNQAIKAASDFDDALRDLRLSALGVRNTLGVALMPVVTRVMGRLTLYLQQNRGEVVRFSNQFAASVERAVPILFKLVDGALQFAKVSSIVIGKVAGLVGGFENLGFLIAAAFSAKAIFSVVAFGGALIKAVDGLQMFFTGKSAILGLSKAFQFLGKSILSVLRIAVVGTFTAMRTSVQFLGRSLLWLAGRVIPLVVGGLRALAVAAISNPVGAVVAGIAIAAVLIIANWKRVKPFFEMVWSKLTVLFSQAWETIKSLAGYSPLVLIVKNWKPILGFFAGIWNGIKSGFQMAIKNIVGILTFSPLKLLFVGWSGVGPYFENIWRKLQAGLGAVSNKIKSVFGFSPTGLIKSAWSGLSGFFDSTKESVSGQLSKLGEAFANSPLAKLSPDWGRLKTKFESIWNSIKGVLTNITDGIKKAFEFRPLEEIKKVWDTTFSWLGDKAAKIGAAFGKIGKFFGFGEKEDADTSEASPAKVKSPIVPKKPAKLAGTGIPEVSANARLQPSGGNKGSQFNNTFNITVNASPGQDEQSIARKVLELIKLEQQKMQSSALYDPVGAY